MELNIRVIAQCASPVRWVHVRAAITIIVIVILVLFGHGETSMLDALARRS